MRQQMPPLGAELERLFALPFVGIDGEYASRPGDAGALQRGDADTADADGRDVVTP